LTVAAAAAIVRGPMSFRPPLASLALVLALGASGAAAAPEPAPPPPARLLVVTVTKGYRHESIATAERVIGELARRSGGFTLDFARDDAELAAKAGAEGRRAYEGVVFASTTGDLPLPDREGFLKWIESGKAFVGVHSASDTWHQWRPFVEMLGGEFDYHRDQARVALQVDDAVHPATRALPAGLEVFDEIYLFKSWKAERVHRLVSLSRHPNHGEPGYYPLAWTRIAGRGRVFYTALGHRDDVLEAEWFRSHLLGGILWALGRKD
jgi:uncharacterized protein